MTKLDRWDVITILLAVLAGTIAAAIVSVFIVLALT